MTLSRPGHNHADNPSRSPTYPVYRDACPQGCDLVDVLPPVTEERYWPGAYRHQPVFLTEPVESASWAPWRWLASTEVLQREAFGFDWTVIGREPSAVAASLKENIFAAYVELAEAAVEFSWKAWAKDEPYVNRERVLGEIIDVGHFMANCLLALGVSDDEYETAYRAKQDLNRRRQATGAYSARKGGLGEGSDAG